MAQILAVDDDEHILELLTYLLQKDGYQVLRAMDGQACLDMVAVQKPDLIILDVMMPRLDGYTVALRLSSDEETRDIPVLVLTAKGALRDTFAMLSNVVGYLDKPFEPDDLSARVAKVLADRQS